MLSPLKPIAMKERVSMAFLQKGQIDVKNVAFVEINKEGVRTHIPVDSVACIMLNLISPTGMFPTPAGMNHNLFIVVT